MRGTLFCAYRDCQHMIRDARWKLIEYRTAGGRNTHLFDLANASDELTNLAQDPAHASELKT